MLSNLGRSDRGPWFTAMYYTKNGCSGCMADIKEGDQIRYIDDELVCARCGQDDDERVPTAITICSECHIGLPAHEMRLGLTKHGEC